MKEVKLKGAKVIVFVVGGICYSEMRSVYEVMDDRNREILIGMLGLLM